VGEPEGSKKADERESAETAYRSDPEGGPHAKNVGEPEGSEKADERESAETAYRSDPEGGPDAKNLTAEFR